MSQLINAILIETNDEVKRLSSNEVTTGFVQIFGSKIEDFSQTFSETIISFSSGYNSRP